MSPRQVEKAKEEASDIGELIEGYFHNLVRPHVSDYVKTIYHAQIVYNINKLRDKKQYLSYQLYQHMYIGIKNQNKYK